MSEIFNEDELNTEILKLQEEALLLRKEKETIQKMEAKLTEKIKECLL
ncbi:MAG: hypothetical protein H7A25_10675 [Leptospiraceae bacterium]|nr:hypothetical protein [Leptospiraceae bacterium]MCP5500358.1 hypothetical protein [Leptospiraceae bacterium]